jgi:hypothetical protein
LGCVSSAGGQHGDERHGYADEMLGLFSFGYNLRFNLSTFEACWLNRKQRARIKYTNKTRAGSPAMRLLLAGRQILVTGV